MSKVQCHCISGLGKLSRVSQKWPSRWQPYMWPFLIKVAPKVIGFFKPGADYYKRDLLLEAAPSRIALDQWMVLPYYDILYAPTDSTDALYQSRYYLQRSSGYIKVEEGLDCSAYIEEAKELTDQVSKEGFSYICPPEFVYYRDKVEQLSLAENVPFSISFSAIELAFSNK